jgi:dienelactone hydrolase
MNLAKSYQAMRLSQVSAADAAAICIGVALLSLLLSPVTVWARVPWNLRALSNPPNTYPAPEFHENAVRGLFFDGVPWKGKPTRVFAWYGVPTHVNSDRVPAVVLVHGGDGTAFANWVRLWNSRGYAAIAIDTCGSVPIPAANNTWQRSPFGGPPCWEASFDQIDWPEKDQWPYHAVAAIILANSLLRSFPEVDPERIGITGISWGGYLTALAASVDDRFRFAAPVYGCGFLGEDSYWVPQLRMMGAVKARKWLGLWDPSVYLSKAKMPFLWVDGTNDEFYPLDSLRKSYLLPRVSRTLSIRVRMPHSHDEGERPEEIFAFADHLLSSTPALATVVAPSQRGGLVWLSYRAQTPIAKADFNYTTDNREWKDRHWTTVIADSQSPHKFQARLPPGVTAYYFNLIDEHGLIVSSDLRFATGAVR